MCIAKGKALPWLNALVGLPIPCMTTAQEDMACGQPGSHMALILFSLTLERLSTLLNRSLVPNEEEGVLQRSVFVYNG